MNEKLIPTVRIAQPKGRPIQLRYTCPIEKRQIRISTGTRDLAEAERQQRELEARLVLGIERPRRSAVDTGPRMRWEDFREQYRTVYQFVSGG